MNKEELEKHLTNLDMQSDVLAKSIITALMSLLVKKNIITDAELKEEIESSRDSIINRTLDYMNNKEEN